MKRAEFAAAVAGIAIFGLAARRSGASEVYEVTHSNAQWRTILGPDRYEILREGGTEPAFSSALITETRQGTYRCAGCNLALELVTLGYPNVFWYRGGVEAWDVAGYPVVEKR